MFRKHRRRNLYWTRERVILGLKRFHVDFDVLPTGIDAYTEKQQFTGDIINGAVSNQGHKNKYPSAPTIRKFFAGMREAWRAAGFEVDSGHEEWRVMEDWFILESAGILPREEVAEYIGRTVAAIKRRLYDLGRVNSKNRWGLTVHKAATLLLLGHTVMMKYLEYGEIPYFKGNKSFYINPADLLIVDEYDWSGPDVPKELDLIVRRALAQRLAKIIKYGKDWRSHEIYTFQPTQQRYQFRIKNPRQSAFAEKLPPVPGELKSGDWVVVTNAKDSKKRQLAAGRTGVIKHLYWSPHKRRPERKKPARPSCWMATVEFPRIKGVTPEEAKRIRYNLAVSALAAVEQPERVKELLQTPSAIKGRERNARRLSRAKEDMKKVVTQLS